MSIVNGSFETGDTTGWTDNSVGTSKIEVTADHPHDGIYSCFMDYAFGNTVKFYQDVDLTDYDLLSFWALAFGSSRTLTVVVDTDSNNKTINTTWTNPTIDISSYTGSTRIEFQCDANLRIDEIGIFVDRYVIASGGNDSNDGESWANAWATVNKAATTVVDGTTVHIGFGTYNAEPANNDIAPVNAGAVGIKYLPETATTGGGTGSVIVEVN
jgi:hypothetical protein